MVVDESWRSDLERWLEPFLAGLSHPARRRMCPQYIAGLIGPGDRKSVQPMAARAGEAGYDQLHHFVAAGIWDSTPLDAALLSEADRLVGGGNAFLVIDDTAMPKKGRHSVGVAPRYATSLGKNANCQTLVSVTLASHEVPVMVGLRLFLPESWTSDPERMARAKVPEDRRTARTKPEIAVEEIDRIRAAGVRFSCVLADAGYGMSAPFRQALSERGLTWAVGIPGRQKVYPADVALIFPVAGHGRPRQHHIPDSKSVAAEKLLAEQQWRSVSWRRGTKGRLIARSSHGRYGEERIRPVHNRHISAQKCNCNARLLEIRNQGQIAALNGIAPRSPLPTVPLAISSIRSKLFLAASRSGSSISIRGCKSRSATYSFSSVFSAMYGQMLQLQLPSAPGAPMKVLPGIASSIWWMMCGSVATIRVSAVKVLAYWRMPLVEPT